jgi:hypothetical protein
MLWLCVSMAVRGELLAGGRPGSAGISADRGDFGPVKVEEARRER